MSLLALIHKSKKVKKLAEISKVLKKQKNILNASKGTKYKYAKGEKYWDNYLKDFSNLYKKVDADQALTLRQKSLELDPHFWKHSIKHSKNKNYLTRADTKRNEALHAKRGIPQNYEPRRQLKEQRRQAILDVWNTFVSNAPKTVKGKPILSKKSFDPIPTIDALQNLNLSLFKGTPIEGIEKTLKGRKFITSLTREAKPQPAGFKGHEALKRPSIQPELNANEAEVYLRKILPNYLGESADRATRGYIADIWRSRPADFRTGVHSLDAENFLDMIRNFNNDK